MKELKQIRDEFLLSNGGGYALFQFCNEKVIITSNMVDSTGQYVGEVSHEISADEDSGWFDKKGRELLHMCNNSPKFIRL